MTNNLKLKLNTKTDNTEQTLFSRIPPNEKFQFQVLNKVLFTKNNFYLIGLEFINLRK